MDVNRGRRVGGRGTGLGGEGFRISNVETTLSVAQ